MAHRTAPLFTLALVLAACGRSGGESAQGATAPGALRTGAPVLPVVLGGTHRIADVGGEGGDEPVSGQPASQPGAPPPDAGRFRFGCRRH